MEFDKVKQKIVLRTADRREFVDECIRWGVMGAVQKQGSVPRFIAPFTAEFEILVDTKNPHKDTHCIRAYPPDHRIYTEVELEGMTFEEFRESVALLGVKGRDRKIMVADYFVAVESIKKQHLI